MPKVEDIPEQDYPPGSYAVEVNSPNRSSEALLTMTRAGGGWPAGPLFNLRIFEADRNGSLHLLYSAPIDGGQVIHPGTGVVNPPMQIGLRWDADKDKERIRFEADVLQTFRTAIRLEFI